MRQFIKEIATIVISGVLLVAAVAGVAALVLHFYGINL